MTIAPARHRLRPLTAPPMAGAGLALALVIIFASNYHVGKADSGGTGPAFVTAVGCLILAGVLFAVVLPRTRRHNLVAVILGVVAIVTTIVFWSGVTPILATASLAATMGAATPERTTRVVQLLAVFAAMAAVAIALAQSHLF